MDCGDHFECAYCAGIAPTMPPLLPEPVEWYLGQAAAFGRNATALMTSWVLDNSAYREARWAASAAMRAVPGLREWE
jgi:hypothetical protein